MKQILVLLAILGLAMWVPMGVEAGCSSSCETFKRGDGNGNGQVSEGDITSVQNCVIYGGGHCGYNVADAYDVNDDGSVNISDVTYLSNYFYLSGSAPPYPFVNEGLDATADSLSGNECDLEWEDPLTPEPDDFTATTSVLTGYDELFQYRTSITLESSGVTYEQQAKWYSYNTTCNDGVEEGEDWTLSFYYEYDGKNDFTTEQALAQDQYARGLIWASVVYDMYGTPYHGAGMECNCETDYNYEESIVKLDFDINEVWLLFRNMDSSKEYWTCGVADPRGTRTHTLKSKYWALPYGECTFYDSTNYDLDGCDTLGFDVSTIMDDLVDDHGSDIACDDEWWLKGVRFKKIYLHHILNTPNDDDLISTEKVAVDVSVATELIIGPDASDGEDADLDCPLGM